MKAWQMGLSSVVLCCGLAAPAWADTNSVPCKVTDPTGTPLNVRETPNGVKIGTLRNGTKVTLFEDGSDSQGRAWGLVTWEGNQLKNTRAKNKAASEGWVLREYISCRVEFLGPSGSKQ